MGKKSCKLRNEMPNYWSFERQDKYKHKNSQFAWRIWKMCPNNPQKFRTLGFRQRQSKIRETTIHDRASEKTDFAAFWQKRKVAVEKRNRSSRNHRNRSIGKPISPSTVRRILSRKKLDSYFAVKKPYLTITDKKKRLKWLSFLTSLISKSSTERIGFVFGGRKVTSIGLTNFNTKLRVEVARSEFGAAWLHRVPVWTWFTMADSTNIDIKTFWTNVWNHQSICSLQANTAKFRLVFSARQCTMPYRWFHQRVYVGRKNNDASLAS